MATNHQSPFTAYKVPTTIGVWGGGLIGLSTAFHFARKGIKTVIYDVNEAQVKRINDGIFPPNFEAWIGFPIDNHVADGSVRATADKSVFELEGISTHFIAVPTQTDGEPNMAIAEEVVKQISEMKPAICIIESTITPGRTQEFWKTFGYLPLGVATRRDWFTKSDNNLENCVRVYAGATEEIGDAMAKILSVVCKTLIRASSPTVVELTKCLDNGIFHAVAMYASQLAVAYPDSEAAEALKLAATHWRLGNHVYFPSIGTGGHCVPLANKYLIMGAQDSEKLTIAAEAVNFDSTNPTAIAALIKGQLKPGEKVGVLGITYRGDIRLHLESPHLKFARSLISLGVPVQIHDPYYTNDELLQETGIPTLEFPDGLFEFRLIYIGANHKYYAENMGLFLQHMHSSQRILDNQGTIELLAQDFRRKGITYHRVGSANWLTTPSPLNQSSTATAANNTVFETKWFKIVKSPDPRSPASEPYYVLHRPDSCTVIPYSEATGRFLLQRQYRAHSGTESWEFPMGAIDAGETPSEAAARELLEETGLTCDCLVKLGEYRPVPGLSTQRTHVFLANVTDGELDAIAVNTAQLDEGISAFKDVRLREFRSMIASGGEDVVDGFTLAAFSVWQAKTASD